MPLPRSLRALRAIAATVAAVVGCAPAPPAHVRVGDGSPRGTEGTPVMSVIESMTREASAGGPTGVEIAPWDEIAKESRKSEATRAREFAADPSVIGVVGHAGSKVTLLAAPIYRAAGVPLIVPNATARELRELREAGPGVFMLAPSNDVIGAFMVDRALDSLGARRPAILYVADAYGIGIRDGVADRLAARQVALVGDVALGGAECGGGSRLAMQADVRALLRRSAPDLVIIAMAQTPTRCAITELVAAAPEVLILTTDSFVPSELVQPLSLRERANVHCLTFWEPGADSLSREFVARVRAATGKDPTAGYALTLDAFLLVAAAVREGYVTRPRLAEWLRALGTPGHPPFVGVTGPIDFQSPRGAVLRLRPLGAGSSR